MSCRAIDLDDNLKMAAKLNPAPISLKDINEHLLESTSDFGFELKVLRELRSHHLKCEHGGHYEDPVTKKSREFDIRALFESGSCRVRLAIECKNIRENYPLLVSLVPRQLDEAYHEFAHVLEPPDDHRAQPRARARPIRFANSRMYPPNQGVVKNTTQVGRLDASSLLTSSDSEIYDKWGQALASATDLVAESAGVSWGQHGDAFDMGVGDIPLFTAVIPILVVPNGRLWGVNYDPNGDQLGEPRLLDRVSCFVGKSYPLNVHPPKTLTLSHLEIVTFDGLFSFINTYLRDTELLFPSSAVRRSIQTSLRQV